MTTSVPTVRTTCATYVGGVDHDLIALPRSVLLALWLAEAASATPAASATATTGPAAAPADLVRRTVEAVRGTDEPHRVLTDDGAGPAGAGDDGPVRTLADLVERWAAQRCTVAAVLPAPGDPAGAPAAVAGPAQDAGEAVLVASERGAWAAVPEVETFGSVYEPGHLVTWQVRAVPNWRTALVGLVGSLPEAERELTVALRRATEALTRLDVARWREDAAEQISALAGGVHPGWELPDGLDGRRVRVLATAARLRAIVDLARDDDGAAVNLWQVDQRSSALRDVDRAARRAMAVATHPLP